MSLLNIAKLICRADVLASFLAVIPTLVPPAYLCPISDTWNAPYDERVMNLCISRDKFELQYNGSKSWEIPGPLQVRLVAIVCGESES